MRIFENDIGLKAEFEEGITDEQIQMRLDALGTNWREIK